MNMCACVNVLCAHTSDTIEITYQATYMWREGPSRRSPGDLHLSLSVGTGSWAFPRTELHLGLGLKMCKPTPEVRMLRRCPRG